MVARYGGYYGAPFKVFRGVTQTLYRRGVNMIVSLSQYVVLFYGNLGVAAALAGSLRCMLNASGFNRLAFVRTYLGRYLGWFELAN